MPPQKPAGFIPDGFIPDKPSGFVPDGFIPDTDNQQEEPGMLSSLWHMAADPLSNAPSRVGKYLSERIDPNRGTSGLRSIASAYLESLGNVGDSLTSPISIALAALSGGSSLAAKSGMSGLAEGLTYGTRALSAPIAAHGLNTTYEGYQDQDPSEMLMGGLETLGGGLGMRTKVPSLGSKAIIPDETPLELYHGTSRVGEEGIRRSGKFDLSQGTRNYDYSVGGPDAAYLTKNRSSPWLSAGEGSRAEYESIIKAKLGPNAKVGNITNASQLDDLAKQAGFADADDLLSQINVGDISDIDNINSARDAVNRFISRTGINILDIDLPESVSPNFEALPEGEFNLAYDKFNNDPTNKILNRLGGNQIIALDPSHINPVFEGPRGLLPERATPERFITGDQGVAQRESLVTPQERMRLRGVDIDSEGMPLGRDIPKPDIMADTRNRLASISSDEFANSVIPDESVALETPTPTRNLRGGTASIEPGEPILPSAIKTKVAQVKDNTGLNVDRGSIPPNTPTPAKTVLADGMKKFSDAAEQPSILFKSIYTQLADLGPAGKDLVQRFQRAAQNRAEYDAAWTEPLFKDAQKLSKAEFANFGAYVEGRMPIPNERVQAAVDGWNKAQNMMGDTATSQGLHLKRGEDIIPFEKIEKDYWPRIPSEVLTKESIVDKLTKRGMPRADAVKVARRWENTGEIFIRGQYSRLRDTFPYRDDFDVAVQHGRSMSKRIANHQNLGPKDIAGKGNEGIANLIEDTSNPNLALKLAKRLAGRDENPNTRLVNGLNQARKWMSLTSLPNFTLPNVILGQTMNAYTAAMSRHPIAAMGEIMNLFKQSYRDEIRASGVFNSFNKSLTEELSGVDPFQIGAGEKINRSIAAAIGRSSVKEAFRDFSKDPNNPSARYYLETLLSRNADTIQSITPEMERFAAGRMAEITQGLNNPGNLPYGWSNPVNTYGGVATQLMLIFKKIGFQTTKTVKDVMMTNPKMAIPIWAGMTQIAGEMVGDVKSLITGKERPDDMNRIADNWGNAFMLGLPWELATSAQYGPSAMLGATLGPAYSKASEFANDVYKTGSNLYEGSDDSFAPMRNFALKNLPIPGRERIRKAIEEQ